MPNVLHGLVEQSDHVVFTAHITHHGDGPAAPRPNGGHDLRRGLGRPLQMVDGDGGTGGRQPQGATAPDARRGAGDDRHPAFEKLHVGGTRSAFSGFRGKAPLSGRAAGQKVRPYGMKTTENAAL